MRNKWLSFLGAGRVRLDGPHLFADNLRLYVNRGDQVIAASIATTGWWARFELDLLLPFLQPGDGVVDVGANIGTHTIPFSRAVGPQGQVLAFEPDQRNLSTLRHNMALNDCHNIDVSSLALWDRAGRLRLHLSAGNTGAHSLMAANVADRQGSRWVLAGTLDDEIRRLRTPRLRMIKMDIQGAEAQVLHGARATLERYRPIVFAEFVGSMLEATGVRRQAHLEEMEGMGYRLFLVQEAKRLVRATTPSEMALLPEAHDNNVLMVPAEEDWAPPVGP